MDDKTSADLRGDESAPRKSYLKITIVVLVILVLLGSLGYLGYNIFSNVKDTNIGSIAKPEGSSSNSLNAEEDWQKNSVALFQMATSSDTHKLADSTFRMYLQKDGNITYVDSLDGRTFSTPLSVGVSADPGKVLSNPAVLKVADNDWILIYEQQPTRQPGSQQGPNGPSTQRNLYLATSADGTVFTKVGIAIDSSVADNYFASVPDLVMLPDGDIRMYYVSGGNATASALSVDDGRTWTREDGYRMTDMAVDADVTIETADGVTKWVMYYTDLNPSRNALFKATSTDGLTWTKKGQVLDSTTSNGIIVDPDVVKTADSSYIMYFGEAASAQGDELNLYSATFSGNIFD